VKLDPKTERLLDAEEAAAVLRCSTKTLAAWRHTGRHGDRLPYLKIGGRVRYRAADLERFLEGAVRTHT
jgi:excisionase family DNA binding protein